MRGRVGSGGEREEWGGQGWRGGERREEEDAREMK